MLPGVEIVCDGPYDYDARYNPGRVEYFAPARLDARRRPPPPSGRACRPPRAWDCGTCRRIDMIVDDAGVAQVIDINIAPGMTETSLFPQAVEASGHELGRVVHADRRPGALQPLAARSPAPGG